MDLNIETMDREVIDLGPSITIRLWPILTGAGAMAAFACGSWWVAGVLAWWWIWAEITPDDLPDDGD